MTEERHRPADSEPTRRDKPPAENPPRVVETETGQLTLPSDVTPEEAAAITVALGAHIQDRSTEAETPDTGDTWDGKRFAFAGRIEGLTGIPRRIPRGAPTDEWTAAGRLDRV